MFAFAALFADGGVRRCLVRNLVPALEATGLPADERPASLSCSLHRALLHNLVT
jgi:hypothetical protein